MASSDHMTANHQPPHAAQENRPGTVCIIQARLGSSRLPGKVLLDIADRPMLGWVVERCRRAATVDQVVVATTTAAEDDPIEAYCAAHGYPCQRGSMHDVLDRYYHTCLRFSASIIVRITADCPLIDPQLIDRTVNTFRSAIPLAPQDQSLSPPVIPLQKWQEDAGFAWDFVANRLPPPWGRTYPIGLDTEVCSFAALEVAWQEARQPQHREHVMPYFYEHPQRFRVLLINHPQDYGALRWTVDTAADLELVRQVCAHFPGRDDFSWLEVLEVFQREPDLSKINASIHHKHYMQVDERFNA